MIPRGSWLSRTHATISTDVLFNHPFDYFLAALQLSLHCHFRTILLKILSPNLFLDEQLPRV